MNDAGGEGIISDLSDKVYSAVVNGRPLIAILISYSSSPFSSRGVLAAIPIVL